MKRTTLAIAAAFGMAIAAQPAFAEAIAVTYQDLDLSTEQGRQELDNRIDSAARKVCGYDDVRTGSRMISKDVRNCYNQARKELQERIASLTGKKKAAGG